MGYDSQFDLVVFDTETTGFDRDARVVELAAIAVCGTRVVDTFRTLVDPGVPIPARATDVHGISNDLVRGAPRSRDALCAFAEFVGSAPLAAHNASYDRRVLAGEFARWHVRPPNGGIYCTCRIARRAFPSAPNHRLETLATYLGIACASMHRAADDALVALGVLNASLARLRGSIDAVHGAPTHWPTLAA